MEAPFPGSNSWPSDQMRVLILTQNYIPEPDPKMHILGKGLVERGHEVDVLTGFPNYPHGEIYPGYRQKPWQKEVIDGVNIVRVPLFPDRSRSVVRRSLNYLSFPATASVLGPFLSRRADVIMVYHPPVTLGIPAYVISRLRQAPFVFEIQDMWPETLSATGMITSQTILSLLSRLAQFTYKRASAITVISPGFKKNLIAKDVPEEKIHVIYNWAYEGEFDKAEADKDLALKIGLQGRFNILYAGNMGPAQGLHNVIEAAALLKDLVDLQFVLAGSGIDHDDLKKQVREMNLKNVLFIARQPMEKMPTLYAHANAVMVHLQDDQLYKMTVPGKTQSCLLSGRPVIASVNGDAADLVVKAGAGLAVRAMDPHSLAQTVRKLYGMPPEKRVAMGLAGRDFYFKHLAPQVQINKYEQLFMDIAGKRRLDLDSLRQ